MYFVYEIHNKYICPHNMVNFGPLAAEILSLVWGTPANFNAFGVLTALLHGILVVGVSQTAALNRGRHLYSAGQPSRWALAHICSCIINYIRCIMLCCTVVVVNKFYHRGLRSSASPMFMATHSKYTTILRPLFQDYPGEPMPEEIFFWTLYLL